MKKIIFTITGCVIVAVAVFLIVRERNRHAVFPDANVLLITIDTVRPDYLSCYGSTNPTPNLDAIARSGFLFDNAFSQVPLTFPSHTSILTGLFPVHTSVHQNGLETFEKPDLVIASELRKHGYKTGAVVSSFVLDRKFGLANAFDIYDDKMERMPDITTNFEVERPGNQTLNAAIDVLKQFQNQKWFLWVHFYDPHAPYAPPPPREGYAGEIQFVDEQIGKLLAYIRENQNHHPLILAVTGDHGESLGEHGEQTHGFFVYNSTLRIPMMLSYPGSKSRKISSLVATVDLVPTILDLTGVQDSQKRDGISLLNENPSRPDIYFESQYAELLGWNGLHGMLHDQWKLISTTRSELYDLQNDAQEKNNLFSAKQDISRPMKNRLSQLLASEAAKNDHTDAETLEKLKSLGYIGTTSTAKPNRMADPKDKIQLWAKYEESLQARRENRKTDVTSILESLVNHEPTNNFFRLSLATNYRENGNEQGSIEQLKAAIQNQPTDSNAYHELAITYRESKNYPEALRAEEAALALDPHRSEFHGIRAMILVETGQPEKAKAEFETVLKMDPNNPVAWNNLGNAYRELNELDAAESAYRKAIELSPHYAYPENGLGTVLVRKDRTREALPHFERALKIDPQFIEVYLNMAIAYHSLNDYARARTLYLAFLKIAPESMMQERQNARQLLSQIP